MSDGSDINLYELAFGLPADTEAPDPYTLLKVAPFTSDAAIIENAVLQRWSDLQILQGFGDGSEVTQLETEVNAARELLLDDARRSELDDQLLAQGVEPPAAEASVESEKSNAAAESPDKQTADENAELANSADENTSDTNDRVSDGVSDDGNPIDVDEHSPKELADSEAIEPKGAENAAASRLVLEKNGEPETQKGIRKLKASESIKSTAKSKSTNESATSSTDDSDPVDGDADADTHPKPKLKLKRKRRRWSLVHKFIGLVIIVVLIEVSSQQVSAIWDRIDFDRIAGYFQSNDSTPPIAPADSGNGNGVVANNTTNSSPNVDKQNSNKKTSTTITPKPDAWQELKISDSAILGIVSSPDGSLLAVATADQRLQIVSADQPTKPIYRSDVMLLEDIDQLQFNAQGTALLVSDSEAVYWWRKQGNWRRGGTLPVAGAAQFSWSGDGQQLAVTESPNNQVTVFDMSRSKPRETLRETGNFLRAAFVGDSNQIVTAGDNSVSSTANGDYTELTNLHDAFIQVRDSKTGELTDVLNVPFLRNNASKIRTIAADKNAIETAIAVFSSVDSESQNLHVWVRSDNSPSKSERHQIVTTSLRTLSGLRLQVDADAHKVSVLTNRDCLVFDWDTASSARYALEEKSKDRLVDMNLRTGEVTVLSPKDGQVKTAAFADVSSRIEPSVMSPTKQRVAASANAPAKPPANNSADALFWKVPYNGPAYVETSAHVIEAFKMPRCRVQFLSDDIFVVRSAIARDEDRVVGFNASTTPPTELFNTTLKATLNTRDVLTVSPDQRYMICLGRPDKGDSFGGGKNDENLKVRVFEIDTQSWGPSVPLPTSLTKPVAVSITGWPERDSWAALTRLQPPRNDGSNGLRFTQQRNDRQTPYVYFGIIGDKWFGTLSIDFRTLLAGLSPSVGSLGNAWPTKFEQTPTELPASHIQRASFSRDGSTAIGQYVYDGQTGNNAGLQSSTLVRFRFGRVLAHESPRAFGKLSYLDHWALTPDDHVVLTNRGGLAIVGADADRSMGRGQLRFDRGDDRHGALATSPSGNTLLMIDRFGSAKLLNWYRPTDQGRQTLQLSQQRIVQPGIDSWVNMRPLGVNSRNIWRPTTPGGANVRLRGRRLFVSFSPLGSSLVVGTPDGVLFWKIPDSFNQMANKMAQTKSAEIVPDEPANRIRSASFNRIVDLKVVRDLLVASIEDDQNQVEVYKIDNHKFVRDAVANVVGKTARLTRYSTGASRHGLAIATDRGQLFLIPDVSAAMRQTQILASSPLPPNSSILAVAASTSSAGLLAYTTPKGRLLVSPSATQTVINRRSISDPNHRDYIAFSINRGSTSETLFGETRRLKTDSQSIYKLYLYSVANRSSSPVHLANTEIALGNPIATPAIIETSTREAIVAAPTANQLVLYGLRAKKLTTLTQQTIANITALAVSKSGTQIAVGTASGEICLWGQPGDALAKLPKSNQELLTILNGGTPKGANNFNAFVSQAKIQAHKNVVSAIVFSADGRSIISGSINGEIVVSPTSTE